MTKLTKKDLFTAIKETFETGNSPVEADVVIEFCEKEIAALDAKAAKAKERAAKKAAEGDELKDRVAAVLTDEYQTIADITAAVAGEDEELSVHKVAYRLTALFKDGKADKTEITVGGEGAKRKVVAYKAL